MTIIDLLQKINKEESTLLHIKPNRIKNFDNLLNQARGAYLSPYIKLCNLHTEVVR